MRKSLVMLVLAAGLPLFAGTSARKAAAPASVAPKEMPHQIALFLASLSGDGKTEVKFKATAVGMRFYFEEPTGVTVYVWDNGGYRKEEFLKGMKLARAVKRYAATVETH